MWRVPTTGDRWLAVHLRKLKMDGGLSALPDGAVHSSSGGFLPAAGFTHDVTHSQQRRPHSLSLSGWTSCSKPGWWASRQHEDFQGHHAASASRRCGGSAADGQSKDRRIHSTDERAVVALTSTCRHQTIHLYYYFSSCAVLWVVAFVEWPYLDFKKSEHLDLASR